MKQWLACTALTVLLGGGTAAPVFAQNNEWTRPIAPVHLIGNIYWVGTYDLSTYLITSPQGHILVNTGLASTVPEIKKSVEQLGFKMSDVKLLTATHGHYDHAAGMAELKRMTGARLVVSERDKDLFETGGKADFRFGNDPDAMFEAVKVDGTFKDGDTLSVGGISLVAHLNAGHTKGATTFTTTVTENGKSYRVAIANMGSINPGVKMSGMPGYPTISQDYAKTFLAQKDMKLDVFLASHASQFGLHEKYKPGDAYNPERFVDPKKFLAEVQRLEKIYLDQVAREKAGK